MGAGTEISCPLQEELLKEESQGTTMCSAKQNPFESSPFQHVYEHNSLQPWFLNMNLLPVSGEVGGGAQVPAFKFHLASGHPAPHSEAT